MATALADLFEIGNGLLYRSTLADRPNLRTFGNVELVLPMNDRREGP